MSSAAPEPPGQYRVALPQGAAVLVTDPAVHTYPELQAPEHAAPWSPVVFPKRPVFKRQTTTSPADSNLV
jgi:hypothetical protein